jgi:hypothetical protein
MLQIWHFTSFFLKSKSNFQVKGPPICSVPNFISSTQQREQHQKVILYETEFYSVKCLQEVGKKCWKWLKVKEATIYVIWDRSAVLCVHDTVKIT